MCRGDGQIKIEMHFLPDVYVPCEQCHGKRYNRETLEVRFKGKTIADVLEMPIEEALEFFEHIPKIRRRVETLNDVGLGYMRLGQPATTLSGGEAQRVKLAAELRRSRPGGRCTSSTSPRPGCTSPTSSGCSRCSQRLVDAGNSVVVIEHNLDVIKVADRLIDLGPGGRRGGRPRDRRRHARAGRRGQDSHTGGFLAEVLPAPDAKAPEAGGARDAAPAPRGPPACGALRCRQAPRLRAGPDRARLKLWAQKWRWYERNSLPWNRARIHWEFARREAFVRWPVHGNVLEALLEGRLEIGPHVVLEPDVWLTAPGAARIRIGGGTFLNIGVMVAATELVEIGEHCMFANGCFISDASHRFDDPDKPVPWQGFTTKGPTRIGDNVWCGAHVVITSGVTIGERSRDRRQLGGHRGHPAVLDRRRRARARAAHDRVPVTHGGWM